MKKLTIFLLALSSYTAQAQVTTFTDATKNAFLGIGGYSFTQQTFPNGVQPTPYVVSGPSPQNDFSYAVSATGGIINVNNTITASNTNTPISIQLRGNNIRKFACRVFGINAAGTNSTFDIISLTAITNLGATTTQIGSLSQPFVGFNVTGNENEYIVSVTASFQTTPSPAARIALNNIMVGDNTPQNVSLNFDGVDDYVSLPSAVGNFTTNQDFTVSCWIKPDATATGEQNIINKWVGIGGYAFTIRYYGNNGQILAGQYDGITFAATQPNTVDLRVSQWHHVAFVKSGSALNLYIDGLLKGSVTDNANLVTTNLTSLQIGREATGTKYFKGEIDEVRIWDIAKDQTTIQNERFCKTPNPTNLQAFYNFSNGIPHDNNALITQIQDAVGSNHGTLNGFGKTGDASNFVTGQVKYVKNDAAGSNNGSSWANAFTNLQTALAATTCNDLFEVYVAKGTSSYKPDVSNPVISFNIPSGMRLYGGFAGTEKSINQRNMALIHSTHQTTLSGDLGNNDTPFVFTTNRTDNSFGVVKIDGSNTVLDGFTISGGKSQGVEINSGKTNTLIKTNKIIDNSDGIYINGNTTTTIANSIISGNKVDGVITSGDGALTINNSLIANNGRYGVNIGVNSGTKQTTISNSTIASNAEYGVYVFSSFGSTSNNTLKNTLIYGNGLGGIFNDYYDDGTINNTITYSLVQGVSTGTGNLNGNTVNPQFVSPLGSGFGSLSLSNLGDYRLKDLSPCINVGDDVGVSPLDLDRNPKPKGGKTDMGAYESNVNMNEIISIITGNWESNSTWNLNRVPQALDKVIIDAGHIITIQSGGLGGEAKSVNFKANAQLIFQTVSSLNFLLD